jgi:uncharacterized membrane protein
VTVTEWVVGVIGYSLVLVAVAIVPDLREARRRRRR